MSHHRVGTWGRFDWLAAALLGCLADCSSDDDLSGSPADGPFATAEGCNPIAADWDCLLPYPSDHFLVDDATTPSGKRLVIPEPAQPLSIDGMRMDVGGSHVADGFSPGSQLVAVMGERLDDSNLVFHTDDVTLSTQPTSPTIVADAVTGELIPHFAELDPRAKDGDQQALIIRPLIRLETSHRYVVGLHGLRTVDGEPATAPEGFRRFRDGQAPSALAQQAHHYETNVFPVLQAAGVNRSSLQLAWDFTTASQESMTADMLAVRSDLLTRLQQSPPVVRIQQVEDNCDEHTLRRIRATVEVPRYVQSDQVGARLNRDGQGHVVADGTIEAHFTILIPHSVAAREAQQPPTRIVQFGHGFFGTQAEIESYLNRFANQYGFVVLAADWWGMSKVDAVAVTDTIVSRPAESFAFADRVHQAMANFLALSAASQTVLPALDEMQVGQAPAYDVEHAYFYGISMGAILGGTYLALSPNTHRAVLNVGGADFSFMMFRARPFALFMLVIQSVLPAPIDHQKFAVLGQSVLDRIDPLTYAPHVLAAPYEPSSQLRVLLQAAMSDSQVPNLATHLHARALGVPHLQPSPRPLPLLPTAPFPSESGLVEYDFGVEPPDVYATLRGPETPVHGALRRLEATKAQIDAFLRPDGTIVNTCDGVCDPE